MPTVQIHKEKLVVPSQLVQVRKQDGKRIIKVFVADSSINVNGHRMPKDAIDSIMPTMKDKDYILPPFLDHPQRPKPYPTRAEDDINLIHDTAKPYKGGTIYDYERVESEDNPGYNAFVELTSDTAIALFDMGMLPRWHSMSIYKLNASEPDHEIRSAVVNNLCAVANPAYGAKARILGMCVGDRDDCTTGLRESSAKEEDEVKEKVKKEGCQTMKAIAGLDPEDTFRFDLSILTNSEKTSSMSQAEAGTTTSETTIDYPASGRQVKMKDGKVVSDTKKDQQVKAESEEGQTTKKEETKEEKTVTKEEKTEGKDASSKNPDEGNNNKDNNKDNEKPTEEEANNKTGSIEERMRGLESNLKNQAKLLEKTVNDNKYLRRKIIEDKVTSAHWLKPEQKEQRIEKYAKMDISTEDLVFALDDAFGAQVATIKSQPNRERQSSSSTQLHEDDNDDNEVTSSDKSSKKQKLTLDLLRPR
jgi:hypothetical protein